MMEIPEEEAKEEEQERKKKKPAKEKHTTKRRLPVPFFKEIKAEGSESASAPRTSKKGRKASTEDEERSAEVGCSVLGRGAEPPQFWVLLIWLEPGISHVTWVHYDATMCLPCFVCSILPVLHFLRFDLCVL